MQDSHPVLPSPKDDDGSVENFRGRATLRITSQPAGGKNGFAFFLPRCFFFVQVPVSFSGEGGIFSRHQKNRLHLIKPKNPNDSVSSSVAPAKQSTLKEEAKIPFRRVGALPMPKAGGFGIEDVGEVPDQDSDEDFCEV